MIYRFVSVGDVQARAAWRRGKGRSRAAQRRRTKRSQCWLNNLVFETYHDGFGQPRGYGLDVGSLQRKTLQ